LSQFVISVTELAYSQ